MSILITDFEKYSISPEIRFYRSKIATYLEWLEWKQLFKTNLFCFMIIFIALSFHNQVFC